MKANGNKDKEKFLNNEENESEKKPPRPKLRNISQKSTDSVRSQSSLYRRPSFQRCSKARLKSGSSRGSVQVTKAEYHENLKPDLASGLTFNLCFASFVIVFGSSFLFGYNIGALNQISKEIKDFYNETYSKRSGEVITKSYLTFLWSLTTAIFIPGGMIGAFSAGVLAEKLGRKKSILISYVFAILGAVFSTFPIISQVPELLMIGRLLVGIHAGLSTALAPMFLSEICPFNYRGAFGTLNQLFITIGILVPSILGLESILGTSNRWPYVLSMNAVPPLICCLILPFLPDSPRFLLLTRKEREAAIKSLQFFRNAKDVSNDMEEMDTEQSESKEGSDESYTVKKLFQNPGLRMPLLIACSLQVIQQLSGINAIFFYSNGIFEKAGVLEEFIPYAVIGTNAVNVIMTIIAVPIMDKAGRRPLLLFPMIAMVIDLFLITIAMNFQEKVDWLSKISVVCVIIYVIGFAVGLGPIPMMIGAELFRQGPRPLAMSCASVVNWTFTFIIAISFESLQQLLKTYTFVLFLVLMIFFTVFVYFKVPETRGKTIEEIAHEFAPGLPIEVEELELEEGNVFDEEVLPSPDSKEDHRLVSFTVPASGDVTV